MNLQFLEVPNTSGDTLRNSYFPGEGDTGVVFIPGFGRNVFEKKFHEIAKQLEPKKVPYLGFNPTGINPSFGEFRRTTFESLVNDLDCSIQAFMQIADIKAVRFVAHSLGAAVALEYMHRNQAISGGVLLAPALNQKDLNLFWAIKTLAETQNPAVKVTYENYQDFIEIVGKKSITTYFQQKGRMTKTDYIDSSYFESVSNLSFMPLMLKYAIKLMHIHGDRDMIVPRSSLGNIAIKNTSIVQDGDHDLERPDMIVQWRNEAVSFLLQK